MMGTSPFYGRLIGCLSAEPMPDTHLFVVHESNEVPESLPPNVDTLTYPLASPGRTQSLRSNARLWRLLHSADLVVFHGLLPSSYLVPINLCPGSTRKGLWVAWGGDLAGLIDPEQLRIPRSTRSLWERSARMMGRFAALTPGDERLLQQVAGRDIECSRAVYFTDQSHDQLEAIWGDRSERAPGPKRILVGNSATPSNRHQEVLELLSRYAPGELEVFVPLGYGDVDYAHQVKEQGSAMLGEAFRPLLQRLSPSEFTSLASTMDVGVFNHDRQQGLGTILLMAALGKKVFLPSDNSSWGLLVEEVGLPMSDTKHIDQLSSDELVALSESDRVRLHERAMRWLSSDNVRSMWNSLLEV